MSKPKPNPHCPVPGCRTKAPHADDVEVARVLRAFSTPEELARATLIALEDIRGSVQDDMKAGREFAWQSRFRQVEELYIRTLYCLLIATTDELPHVLSGAMPNSVVTIYYPAVNEVIFKGNGAWDSHQEAGVYTPINILHGSGHASFVSIYTAMCRYTLAADEREDQTELQRLPVTYITHLNTYCDRMHYIQQMFNAGKAKQDVLGGVTALHRPASYWEKRRSQGRSPTDGVPVENDILSNNSA